MQNIRNEDIWSKGWEKALQISTHDVERCVKERAVKPLPSTHHAVPQAPETTDAKADVPWVLEESLKGRNIAFTHWRWGIA
jgi:hypothetical protein